MDTTDTVVDEPVETPEKEPSVRDALEAAIEEVDPNLDGAEQPEKATEPAPLSTEQPVPVPAAPDTSLQADKPQPSPAAESASTELKAPAQWKPAVREKWNALPREVQEEVLRREGDSMRLIGSVGPKLRMADELQSHIAPFSQALQTNGVSPSAFVHDVFASIRSLAHGDDRLKAETVANIVQAYGVDVRALDQVLTGRIQAPPEVLEARMATARANAVIRQQSAGVEYQTQLEAEKSVVGFAADPKHEFLDDVRNQMADLIELGHAKTLEDAYQSAVWSNPATRQILLTREAQSRAAMKNNRANAARRASSSVRGAPGVPGAALAGAAGGGSLRETLEAAFDDAQPL